MVMRARWAPRIHNDIGLGGVCWSESLSSAFLILFRFGLNGLHKFIDVRLKMNTMLGIDSLVVRDGL